MRNKTQINTVDFRHGLTRINTVVKLISLCPLCSLWLKHSAAKRKGMTLTEMTVVIGIIAIMVGLTLPVANVLYNSFESTSGTKAMFNSALSSARAIAIKEHRYAGIRFQKRYDPDKGVLDASQYMIFIVHDPNLSAYEFKAVDGIQPIKLPDSIGVMDLTSVQRNYSNNPPFYTVSFTETPIANDLLIDQASELSDTTAFSIIFSPSGKLIIKRIQVINRNGNPDRIGNTALSYDDIFNKKDRVDAGLAIFYQDDYGGAWWSPWAGFNIGLGPEYSRNSFYIYETKKLKQVPYNNRWTGYLSQLKQVFVSPYSGTIIEDK